VLDRRWSDRVRASLVDRADPGHAALRARWLADHPKAKLYIDFGHVGLVRLTPRSALPNGDFGRAVRLTAQDLGGQAPRPTDGSSCTALICQFCPVWTIW
jgi:putative heme iron utilization protein